MRAEKSEIELAMKREFVRGYLTAVEDMSRDVQKSKTELESQVVAVDFQTWCNLQKSCKECPCNKYSDDVECIEAYTRAIREGRVNETS